MIILTEHSFFLEEVSPLEFYGVNNARLDQGKNRNRCVTVHRDLNAVDQLKAKYPNVLFVARGNALTLKGPAQELSLARDMVEVLLDELAQRGSISQQRFTELLLASAGGEGVANYENDEDFVLHGTRGTVPPRATPLTAH